MNRKKCLTIAVAAAIIVAAAICLYFLAGHHYLTLRDAGGRLYARYRMKEGDSFSVSFIHSVNKEPLWDIYEIHEGKIWVEACKYGNFGAGVQYELNPGEVMSMTDDGFILITGIHQDRTNMRYNIAGISDHMLELPDGTAVNLRELCGKGSPVWFNYEYLVF